MVCKGGDYLCVDMKEIMAREAIETVYDLEHGTPPSIAPRTESSTSVLSAATPGFGKGPVKRACYAADRTGHMILQTLYQQCLKNDVHFLNEYQVMDLVFRDRVCQGVVAYRLATGELHVIHAKAVMPGDRRLRPGIQDYQQRACFHGGWNGAPLPSWNSFRRHGVFSVPSYRNLQDGDFDHRRGAR